VAGVAAVEREEARLRSVEPGGHVDLGLLSTAKWTRARSTGRQQRLAAAGRRVDRRAVVAVLADRLVDVLLELALQLGGGDR
jgi:hypothetical protein